LVHDQPLKLPETQSSISPGWVNQVVQWRFNADRIHLWRAACNAVCQ